MARLTHSMITNTVHMDWHGVLSSRNRTVFTLCCAVSRCAVLRRRQDSSDGKAHTYDDHEDSVYGLSWSAVDPWLFASMSYDGRLMVNRVPKNIKYKILI